jgi:arsenate reductase
MTPSVLFVCVHNAGRSQMAAGFLRHLAGDAVEVRSAGSLPADQVNPAAVAAMAEVGIDITGQRPRVLTTEAVEASDVVVTMGCGDACPVLPGTRYLDWQLARPAGASAPSGPSATTSRPGCGRCWRSCCPTPPDVANITPREWPTPQHAGHGRATLRSCRNARRWRRRSPAPR